MNKLRILLADDHPVVLEGLRSLLEAQADIEVVATVPDGAEVVDAVRRARPALVIMDVGMPRMNGARATRELKSAFPNVKVLALTVHEDRAYLRELVDAGASGYLVKRAAAAELVSAVRNVAAGGLLIDARMAQKSGLRGGAALKDALPSPELSERELLVFCLIAEGFSNKEIGTRLAISSKTVETYKRRVMEKLGLETRPELVRYALNHGLLRPA